MTPEEGSKRVARYGLLLRVNILRAMDRWTIQTVRHVIEKRMQRKGSGDPPNPPPGPLAIRTGGLARTVSADRARYVGGAFRVTFRAGGPEAPYGRIHEFGGLAGRGHRSLIPARPYLGPSIADRRSILSDDIADAAKATRGQAGLGA